MIKLGHLIVAAVLFAAAGTAPCVEAPEQSPGQTKAPLYAVAAEGGAATAEISKLAGIAPYFHLYGEDGAAVEVVPNPYLDLEFGTGPAAAQLLVEKGVVVLVARRIPGPKMMEVLDNNSVRFVRRVGVVEDVASELKGIEP
jgi:predicted Fe-Mo cluster-binding NifX family protein